MDTDRLNIGMVCWKCELRIKIRWDFSKQNLDSWARLGQSCWKIEVKSARPPAGWVWEDPGRNLSLQYHTAATTGFYRQQCTIFVGVPSAQIWCIAHCIIAQSSECIVGHVTYLEPMGRLWKWSFIWCSVERLLIKTIGKKSLSVLTISLILTPCCASDIWQIGWIENKSHSCKRRSLWLAWILTSSSKGLLRFYDLAASRHSSNLQGHLTSSRCSPAHRCEAEEGSVSWNLRGMGLGH